MMYEVSREVFKQRLEERGNFILVHVCSTESEFSGNTFKDSLNVIWSRENPIDLDKISSNKNQNILFYSLLENHDEARKAAELAEANGYKFVYFYLGKAVDKILDKGLN